MASSDDARHSPKRGKRSDARRNQQVLLDAAAAVFVESGVDAPVREIAARAGVGMGTVYRHFPSRGDLVVAVYRHQVDTAAAVGPELLASQGSAVDALHRWVGLFVDFLVTKHGLARALQDDREQSDSLHRYFVDHLVPVCAQLLDAATEECGGTASIDAYALLRGIGNLCIGGSTSRYDPNRLAHLLVAGVLADVDSRRSAESSVDDT